MPPAPVAPEGYQTESILKANKQAAEHGIDLSKLPKLMDLSAASITENVHAINSNCPDERTKFIFKHLIQHIHDFVRETSLTTEEWMTAIHFLTQTGKTCSDIRQEFILLSDTLGVSALVDSLNNAKPPGATEGSVLGPFFTEDAYDFQNGESIASEGKGEYMYVHGRVLDTKGKPVPHAVIDTWETDGFGMYDTQYSEREKPECRGRLKSDGDGNYAFRAVVPVSYPIPSDGPVGKMVTKLGRHVFRPAHLHMQIEAPGYEKLTTALYPRGDPYISSDAVFGVKSSLIVDLKPVNDPELATKRGFGDPNKIHMELEHDFILATPEEGKVARKKTHEEMMKGVKTGMDHLKLD
ncbi:intradiol ring-cleavage dioxygenase [Dendrothele bispora CBS 962.96]|uniref:Intradiol ring-cleavage dioxygenase n=1 Tax=Dendrothele bispora (strain CBS 962.96) TaxID=1314807 RepID=A0A4S8LSG9_DENBC|nr:intradiol ring-cleavage dioxygenase [Dendrothele bispora CBS 962.96]